MLLKIIEGIEGKAYCVPKKFNCKEKKASSKLRSF